MQSADFPRQKRHRVTHHRGYFCLFRRGWSFDDRQEQMRYQERENIKAALKSTKWKISGVGGTAEMLGIKPTTLLSRMKKMSIERPI